MAKHEDKPKIKSLSKKDAARWLNDNNAFNATIEYVKMDLTFEQIGGRLWVDPDAEGGKPHVVIVADTYGYSHIPLARAAVAVHLTDDMEYLLDDESEAKEYAQLDITRGDPIRNDATLGDQSVTIRINYGDRDRGDIDQDD